ncbi:hypothetical protein KHP57_13010 [Algiphilus sp. NNCM1]|nr:hypothetical protein [Algiphilus acroporae]MCI5062573.1 hypothetical protein [Algiphilus sp.]
MTRLLRHPLLHFFAIGATMLVAAQALQPMLRALETPTLRVTTADRQQLRQQWLRETGVMPTDGEMRALLQWHVDEAILFEEALRLGLAERDPVVRDRLLRNMRFVQIGGPDDDEALLRQAQALGMLERDPVVRRRLVQRMRHRLESQAMVDDAMLWTAASALQAMEAPAAFSFVHVFFSSDLRENPLDDARAAISRLGSGQDAPVDGDGFLLGAEFASKRATDLAQLFGPTFATAVASAPVGVWSGPVPSPFGVHLIRVSAATEPPGVRAPTLRQVVLHARQDAEKEALRIGMERLRSRYRIIDAGDALETAMRP